MAAPRSPLDVLDLDEKTNKHSSHIIPPSALFPPPPPSSSLIKSPDIVKVPNKEMSSGFQTPNNKSAGNKGKGKNKKNKNKNNSPSKRNNAVGSRSSRAKAVDLVTGKTTVEYFFDPSLVLQDNNDSMTGGGTIGFKTPSKKDSISASTSSASAGSYLMDPTLYASRHLFVPCTIVKSLSNPTNNDQSNSNAENNNSSTAADSGPALVKTADGALHKIRDASQLTALTAPDDYIGMSDILNLASVTEASLLHTLRVRYKRDDIYTSAGPILISINPYKPISFNGGESLYSDNLMMEYRKKIDYSEQEPHLFQVADRAYTALMDSVHNVPHLDEDDADIMVTESHDDNDPLFVPKGQPKNQSIIISGESGAGKTEATKYIMQYLARITKKKDAPDTTLSPDGKVIAGLEDRVLSSNPLLETFGNAQTLRNDNSSRFGKFIHINFSTTTGSIVNASISNYLLEKTRITTQIEGERNYHIFYQLFAGASPELLEKLGLDVGPAAFAYLGNRESLKSDKDKENFEETVACLSRIGLATEEQTSVFKVAAAVLHIGNISFEEQLSENGEHIAAISETSRPILEKACDLLGFKSEDVLDAILTKLLVVGGKTIKKASSLAVAEDKRDALAKMTYSSLFLWLVNSVNETLNEYGKGSKERSDEKLGYIGVLDIYGFECFETNGYEQLLINYCNEKLQRHFNRHLFEVEQKLYSAEGVDWTYITFNDNRPCLELIEGGGGTVGILNTLDDAWGGMGNASEKDGKFVHVLHKLFGGKAATTKKPDDDGKDDGHEYFVTPKFGNDRQFIIVHYAGEVRYTADGFVEKNMESLSNEMKDLGESSTSQIARAVYDGATGTSTVTPPASGTTRRSTIRGVSVASQFKMSLQSLVDDLEQTQPHYIRCIKPNLKKAPNGLAAGEVLKQLRYSGMMEAIRIRREGYALREDHMGFYNRFSVLLTQEDTQGGDGGIEHLVQVLSKRLGVSDADWQIGHSKIFMRRELSEKLERLAKLRVHAAARTLGRFGKSLVEKRVTFFLVAWARFRLVMLRKYRRMRASNKIGAAYRAHVQVRQYKAARQAVIKIQSIIRRRSAMQHVRKLRDPYCDMTFKELKRLLRTEISKLEKAANEKDFKTAAQLEATMELLKQTIEERRPETRAVVEQKIDAVQKKIDDALRNKAYSEAAPLQDELESLLQKRSEMPTLQELRDAVKNAETALSQAAKNRDFSRAAELQAAVDEAKKRLAETLADDDQSDSEAEDGIDSDIKSALTQEFESRADLERAISDFQKQIKEAIDSKDFKKAASLQSTLEEKEMLRVFFPSLEELQAQIQSVKARLEEAVGKKDFGAAHDLQDEIASLEKKMESEKEKMGETPAEDMGTNEASAVMVDGTKKVFQSRHELESEITAMQAAVSEAIAAKEFKKAEECQALLEKLEKLRENMPSISELNQEIQERKKEIEFAISEKRFADADLLHRKLENLEKKLETAKALEPAQLQDKTLGQRVKTASVPTVPRTPAREKTAIPVLATPSAIKKATPRVKAPTPVVAEKTPSVSVRAVAPPAKNISSASSVHSAPVIRHSASKVPRHAGTVAGGGSPKDNFQPPLAVTSYDNDDMSDVTSVQSFASGRPQAKASSKVSSKPAAKLNPLHEDAKERPVSKLRPKKPLTSSGQDSILTVTKMLATKRGDASLIVNESGGLAGIITDTDITRRVVARHVDPSSTAVSEVMTPNPTCVSMTDSAMDAMSTMVENHFRHLPVVDEQGAVVGLLDIAKCLNDAITKLERSQSKGGNAADEALKQAVGHHGAQGAQAAALHALLGPLMAQAFGNQTSPSLRSLLAGKPSTIVSPDATVLDAGMLMAERRKAALVVADNELVGIFGFKDLMTRVIAKELPLEQTEIGSVMTPSPESVSPDMTVLEALQMMHDNKFLTLPVCEEDGTVVGIVDVMDVIYGCGGVEGWRSIFSSSLDLDDVSDTASMHSGRGSTTGSTAMQVRSKKDPVAKTEEIRPVSKLRPKKPLISHGDDTILTVTQMLANKRGDAALIVDKSGGLAGILTDTDITRRVVARHVDPSTTNVSDVMTPNPTCVSTTDSAMDAMSTMVENHFRHLPVVDDKGAVVGLLDIAKCLNDAISKLERSQAKGGNAADEALKQVVGQHGAQGAQAAALQALLGPLMAQAFGNQTSPTLRSLLAGKPNTIVTPDTTVLDAGMLMAERRKAALVVEDNELIGIFGFKDLMTRVIAKELSLEQTDISSVMTSNPEAVSPDLTVLDALQMMHENKFLTLPVCEKDGTVVGIVDVMDVILGCGGAEGWRSIFSSSLEMDDISDTASMHSGRGSKSGSVGRSVRSARKASAANDKESRPVSKLRPKKPLISYFDDSILTVTQMLANKRGDASLVVNESGGLAGIITDTDITRRVVARHINPSTTNISHVMTPNPTCVSMTDPAMDAMSTMVENHFRHLPVVDDKGAVVGLLDIAKCLNDAISKLERSQSKGGNAADEALKQVVGQHGAQGAQAAALQALLGPLMAQAFGNQTSPTLRSLLAGKPNTIVTPDTTVLDAGMLMAERRKAALVVEDNELVGIFGFKDLMTRVIAKELALEQTHITSVMTPNPESVSPDLTVLEALQIMHENKFLTLPVCEKDGTVVGIVDVMDVIHGCGGAEGWRSIFSSSLDLDDVSDTASIHSGRGSTSGSVGRSVQSKKNATSKTEEIRPVSKLRPKKPLISHSDDSILTVTQMLANKRGDASLVVNESGGLAGIITDTDITRRVVARHINPSTTNISHVMTPNPTCVSMTDPAMDAMSTMVENHFRHLPVVDQNGSVVGLLDIAKCLNDAISKLERSQSKGGNAADEALKQVVGQHGAQGAQAAALQALLGPLMAQAFGNQTSPTLRSLLAGKPNTIVSPDTTVLDAGMLMAERRKAALVVEDNELVGIFGFKDLMTRVIAKELALEQTHITSVMTPNPESVSPDLTVLEALQIMHENKFLTLPVCEKDGTVVGIVDVMDVIHGCGGAEGWRSIFSSSLDLDDVSDTASMHSGRGSTSGSVGRSVQSKKNATSKTEEIRPVSKLRPKKPLISYSDDSILTVTQMLANKHGDASLVVDQTGGLVGILTDTDITRRVVARHVDASSTSVSHVMTPSPTCVSMTDSAMDAMSTMVENHFRHLPVVDQNGSVVGLLDIAKCLNDAITKLERSQSKGGNAADEALRQVVGQHGAKDAQAAALQALLGPLMAQAFGNQTSPTLRSLLAGKPSTIVSPDATVLDAGMLMAERRKAALVVADNELVGIFGFKDLMTRVIAKELPLEQTEIGSVMTPSPESVSPDMTVLEALQTMHDNKFLTLPVCEEDGTVVGIVDVMDVIYGCGGVEGWRSIFSSSLDLDDVSDTASMHSGRGSAIGSTGRSVRSQKKAAPVAGDERPVSKLRPKKPLLSYTQDSILDVTKMLANKRGDASLVVDDSGGLAGILTDTDITRRVVARHVDPSSTAVSQIMTPNPTCVSMTDPAMDAMSTMVENHFRHLPVVDDKGAVVGLLDIAKCLNDAISKLERSQSKGGNAADEALKQVVGHHGAQGAQAAALQALLGPLMAQAFGNQTSPTLRSLLAGKPNTIVTPDTTVLDAGMLMAERRKAALVVEDNELIGLFSFKDLMTRVVAKELPLEQTDVSSVMTPDPESVSPDMTVLEALQMMHDNKFLTLPVCEADGTVLGVVDVMDVIYGCGGAEGWRSIFSSALDLDDLSDSVSRYSGMGSAPGSPVLNAFRKKPASVARSNAIKSVPQIRAEPPRITVGPDAPFLSPGLPGNIPRTLEFKDAEEDHMSRMMESRADYSLSGMSPEGHTHTLVFKVVDPSGNTHRIRSEAKLKSLRDAFDAKLDYKNVQFSFVDDEGDMILISSDTDLSEAVNLAGGQVVKLTASEVSGGKSSSGGAMDPMLLAAIGVGVASIGLIAMVAFRPKK